MRSLFWAGGNMQCGTLRTKRSRAAMKMLLLPTEQHGIKALKLTNCRRGALATQSPINLTVAFSRWMCDSLKRTISYPSKTLFLVRRHLDLQGGEYQLKLTFERPSGEAYLFGQHPVFPIFMHIC